MNDSIRNGAAMRSVPIGLFDNIEDVLEKAKIQAKVTHDTHEGIVSSQAVALMTFYFKNKIGNKFGLKDFVEKNVIENFKDDYDKRVPCDGVETIDAVLTVLKNSNSYREILDQSIRLGGDTDSVASIALGVASFSDEYETSLPLFLFKDLESGKYGREYIMDLDKKIIEKFEK